MRGQDFTGLKFGRLTGIRRVANVGRGLRWLWQCECGKETVADPSKVKLGHTTSCGCFWVDKCRIHRHGHNPEGKQTRTYKAWANMKSRVRPNSTSRKYYADRGITVCEWWRIDFRNFLADMGECPDGLTLDRINNDGNYEPGNCRWATIAEQNRNLRRNRMVVFQGQRMCLADACKLAGMDVNTVLARINKGMDVEEALMLPAAERQRQLPLRTLVLEYGTEWMMY